jgi:hypothetical protein
LSVHWRAHLVFCAAAGIVMSTATASVTAAVLGILERIVILPASRDVAPALALLHSRAVT